jgi:hypothetical protein
MRGAPPVWGTGALIVLVVLLPPGKVAFLCLTRVSEGGNSVEMEVHSDILVTQTRRDMRDYIGCLRMYYLSESACWDEDGSWEGMSWDSLNGPGGVTTPVTVTWEMWASAVFVASCEVTARPR